MTIASTLRSLRESKGLTQQQLAEKSGVPQKTISNIEQGVSDNPSWNTMVALASAMGVDCTAFTRTDQPPERPTGKHK